MTLPELHRPDWQSLAACRGAGPDPYFPNKGTWVDPRRLCGQCPVTAECLDFALRNRIHHGTWGGVSERGRRKMLGLRSHKLPGWREINAAF